MAGRFRRKETPRAVKKSRSELLRSALVRDSKENPRDSKPLANKQGFMQVFPKTSEIPPNFRSPFRAF